METLTETKEAKMAVSEHAFTVAEYHSMVEAGVFGEDEHIELPDGRIRELLPTSNGAAREGGKMIVGEHAFTVDEYHCMVEAGVFGEEHHIELLGGRIWEKMSVGSVHSAVVSWLVFALLDILLPNLWVRGQDPIRLSDLSEPEPDVAVVFRREDFYRDGHPTPEDIRLLIEVSDSTWTYDSQEKLPCYALAGVPEAWLINVNDSFIEQHTEPSGEQYRTRRTWSAGETISLALPSGSIDLSVAEILK